MRPATYLAIVFTVLNFVNALPFPEFNDGKLAPLCDYQLYTKRPLQLSQFSRQINKISNLNIMTYNIPENIFRKEIFPSMGINVDKFIF